MPGPTRALVDWGCTFRARSPAPHVPVSHSTSCWGRWRLHLVRLLGGQLLESGPGRRPSVRPILVPLAPSAVASLAKPSRVMTVVGAEPPGCKDKGHVGPCPQSGRCMQANGHETQVPERLWDRGEARSSQTGRWHPGQGALSMLPRPHDSHSVWPSSEAVFTGCPHTGGDSSAPPVSRLTRRLLLSERLLCPWVHPPGPASPAQTSLDSPSRGPSPPVRHHPPG